MAYHSGLRSRCAAAAAQRRRLKDLPARGAIGSLARLAEQKDLLLAILAHSLAAVRDEVVEHLEAKLERLAEEVHQVRADLTIARFNNKEQGGEIIDLPNPLRKRA